MDQAIRLAGADVVLVGTATACESWYLRAALDHGASAVIYSGYKFLSGVTGGIVTGARDLIRATYLQHRGMGRTMKAGKESDDILWSGVSCEMTYQGCWRV